MKKAVFIAICILGILSFSSCRSTAKSCGLAENINQTQQNHQVTIMATKVIL